MTTFYTPGTGLPDFEMRIALGLAAAALNAVEPGQVCLRQQEDAFAVDVDDPMAEAKIAHSLGWLCANKLGQEATFRSLPGAHSRWVPDQTAKVVSFGRSLLQNPRLPTHIKCPSHRARKGPSDFACSHDREVFSMLLVFSPSVGKPPTRDNWTQCNNLPVCHFCATLALLGVRTFQLSLGVATKSEKRAAFFAMPHFTGTVRGDQLTAFVAGAKCVVGKAHDVSANAILLALFARHPSLLSAHSPSYFCSRYEPTKSGARYDTLREQVVAPEARFLSGSPDPLFRRAFVQRVYGSSTGRAQIMGLLTQALHREAHSAALDLCRTYASHFDKWPYLHEDVTLYLAGKEVCNVDSRLLDREGEDYKAMRQVADMLKFFVGQRNFGYVDSLRRARSQMEFVRILTDAQRNAQGIVLDPKRKDKPRFLPPQEALRRVVDLANQSDDMLRDVQALLALLAFTQHRKEESQ